MNIYLIHEDGESFCIQAESMQEAISITEHNYLEELFEEGDMGESPAPNIKYYHAQILQSCNLIGELRNVIIEKVITDES